MNLLELHKEVEKQINKGNRYKEVVISTDDGNLYHIDSIQQNNHSSKEADYLILMSGTTAV